MSASGQGQLSTITIASRNTGRANQALDEAAALPVLLQMFGLA